MVRVLIADDERNIQKAYRSDIQDAADRYSLAGTASRCDDAVVFADSAGVDLILMDINTPGEYNGLEACRLIKEKHPGIKIIITTSYTDLRAFDKARECGADSFWLKELSPENLVDIMDRTMKGESVYPDRNLDVMLGQARLSDLTAAEIDCLYKLIEYVSVKKMAEKMCVEESTVKTHLLHLCRKTGCDNKAELAILAANARLAIPDLHLMDVEDQG
ncbi:response regulator transcription factor [Butyrivibrio sp. MC2013]|uniref:response regulator transcription factor n=1 Tax=Butyrivibrio sp. MC2013 TaxID=1280686 RepID=UPI000428314F|nr:response regulator transcription factor [Butyrivibrio sp. MC2013]